ncbi:MAG: hypothetical protein GWM92_07065 [Gemmatimonadetes bacterium]|nr:hypothetical protein [Gemmatimonadota bacterium]NIR78382.1 hypothetical protein [Gemmatimonadota bacterium]NIT86986.1 hypothetical protein [Gemmatimonadota bacterium]NIU30830.1 hypothetical protein [Gemmatimonadota bacterium]NIU35604.1 hypothetical protein [Gemmatimonadota bacterium]
MKPTPTEEAGRERETPSSAAARAVSLGEEPEAADAAREPEREMWERAARLPPQDPTVRMFEKEWMEKLSRVHPLVPHALFVPVVAFMVWRSLSLGTGALATTGLALLGLLAWTVTEFLLHRYVFHEIATEEIERSVARKAHRLAPDQPIVPNLDGWREKFYFVAHGVHHEFPSDPRRLVMPPSVSVPLAVLFWLLFSALLGPAATPAFFAGFVVGYLIYDSFHFAIHFIRPGGRTEVAMYRMGKGHMRHHFSDNTKDYGVSSPLWDLLVGTFDWEERAQFGSRFLGRWIEGRRKKKN